METHIPYSFEEQGHMPVQRNILSDDGSWTAVEQTLHIPVSAFNPEPLAKQDYSISYSKILDTRFGSLASHTVNRDTGALAIHALAWGGTTEHPVTEHEALRIADALPGHTVMSLTMPGHGYTLPSSRWPAPARMQMLTSGSFTKAGEHLSRLLQRHHAITEAESVDVFGTSTGARPAISLAASLGRKIDNLVLFDPPGSSAFGKKNFIERFRVHEAKHGKAYRAASRDEQHNATMDAAINRTSRDYILTLLKRDPLAAYDFYQGEISAMSRPRLGHDLRGLHNVRRLVMLSPESSALNNLDDMQATMAVASGRNQHTVFEHYTFPGTHTITRMASTVLAELFKTAVRPAA